MSAKFFVLTDPNLSNSRPIEPEIRISQAQDRLADYVQNHDKFTSKTSSRSKAMAELTNHRDSTQFKEQVVQLQKAKTDLQLKEQSLPDVNAARRKLGPFYFFRDSAFFEYMSKNTGTSVNDSRTKTLGGILLSTLGKVSSPIGAAVFGLTAIPQANVNEPYRKVLGAIGAVFIGSSFVINWLPDRLKLGKWQDVASARVSANSDEQKKSINIATTALLDSYLDPILAVSMQLVGLQLVKFNETFIFISAGGLVATQLTSYLSMRTEHPVTFQRLNNASAVATAATLIGLSFGLDRNNFRQPTDKEFTDGLFFGSVIAPAAMVCSP